MRIAIFALDTNNVADKKAGNKISEGFEISNIAYSRHYVFTCMFHEWSIKESEL